MRNSFFGNISLVLFGLTAAMLVIDLATGYPTFRTLFAPMFCVSGALVGALGAMERDKKKVPAYLGTAANVLMLGFWVLALVLRISSAS